MLTSGTLGGLQELLASWLAHDRNKDGSYLTSRVPKMALYGAFVSAPLGHVLISTLQWIFRGRTSLKAKILQILASNLIVSRTAPDWRYCPIRNHEWRSVGGVGKRKKDSSLGRLTRNPRIVLTLVPLRRLRPSRTAST